MRKLYQRFNLSQIEFIALHVLMMWTFGELLTEDSCDQLEIIQPHTPSFICHLCEPNHRFFSFGIITDGDWGYLPNLLNGHHAVYIWRSVMSLGDTVLDLGQWSRQLFPVLGKLGFDYALSERILFLWPSVLCSSVGFYYFGKYIRKSSIAGFITSFVFGYNTYFLTLQTGHVTLATAFSMFGIIWLLYNQFLIKKSGKYLLYTILVFFIAFGYEPRAAYIIGGILFLYTLFRGITNNSNKGTIILLLCIGGLLFLAINIWRMLPLTESIGNVNNHDILTRGLFGSQYFNIVHALTLHHPWRDGELMKHL